MATKTKTAKILTQADLKALLSYDPATGEFRRVKSTGPKAAEGDSAGYVHSSGYRYISLNDKPCLAHRLAFLYMTGEFPPDQVDHINGNRSDNRWENLRAVTKAENSQNAKAHRDSASGVLGVSRSTSSEKWRARIYVGGKELVLGYFQDKAEALAARKAASEAYGFHPNHGRSS